MNGVKGCMVVGGSLALALLVPAGVAHAQSYRNFDELTRELRSLTGPSNAAQLRSIGRSHEGRDIWLVEIGSTSGVPLGERPGILMVGNLEGDQLIGSELALGVIRHLLGGGDSVAGVLANQVVYVVPRLNPDAAEAMFARVRYTRTRNARPHDDDNDGRVDEDPPEDLNGDGAITMMRVRDPSGAYMVDPDDARLMKRADRAEGESGSFALYWEGRDSDGDGFFSEDGAGGVDLNRNFQHAYPYWRSDAGLYMVSEPETRALMDFTLAHGNIGAIVAFGPSDNLVTAPDSRGTLAAAKTLDLVSFADASNADVFDQGVFRGGGGGGFGGFGFFFGGGGGPRLRGAQPGADNDPQSGRRPSTTVHRDDIEYFSAVSEAYKEVTGITAIGLNREAEGAFFQYGYYQFGVPSFSTPGWGLPKAAAADTSEVDEGAAETPQPTPPPGERAAAAAGRAGGAGQGGRAAGGSAGDGTDATMLKAYDAAGIDAFVNWSPFAHPELGEVEIGGFRPYVFSNPPEAQLEALGQKHGAFVARLASVLPRVRIAGTEVTSHGGGVFTVMVEVENAGFFPTSTQHGVMSRSVQPTTVQIQVPTDAVLTGAAKTSTIQKLDGSGAREKFTWVIQGRQGSSVEIRVRSQKGGSDTATVTLR